MNFLLPFRWGLLLFFCLSVGMTFPDFVKADSDLESFLNKVENSSAAVDSFSCDFIQIKHLSIFPKPVRFTGRLSLERPDKLRWEFISPLPSVIVLNGLKGMKCDEEGPVREFNLDRDPVMGMVADQMWAWTSGSYLKLRDDFEFNLKPGPTLVFSPLRKEMESFIGNIEVLFDPQLLQPVEVKINEPGGDRTEIVFSDYKRNLDLDNSLFTSCRPRM